MGLFGPRKEFRERTFTAPCSRQEFLSVLADTRDYEQGVPFQFLQEGALSSPPLVETIYLETLSDRGFVVVAGNRAKTFWKLRLDLQGGNPVSGTFGALLINDEWKWPGNVLHMNFALADAVRSIGGRTEKWPI